MSRVKASINCALRLRVNRAWLLLRRHDNTGTRVGYVIFALYRIERNTQWGGNFCLLLSEKGTKKGVQTHCTPFLATGLKEKRFFYAALFRAASLRLRCCPRHMPPRIMPAPTSRPAHMVTKLTTLKIYSMPGPIWISPRAFR